MSISSRSLISCLVFLAALSPIASAQTGTPPSTAKAPLDHVIGTISAVDKTAQTVTVKEDKTDAMHTIQLTNTKTLLKVEPTAKDLKSAVRITADDLVVGDRVDVRGTKLDDAPTTLNARSVILMSGRALAVTHEQQAAAWAQATSGKVTAVDPSSGKIIADVRAAGTTSAVGIQTAKATEFTRFSAETGKAAPSELAQIQVGDQVKVIGDKNEDGTLITAQRVYSGAFRTFSATISSIAADGKSLTVKDLTTKKDVNVSVNADASIHKLPPMMAGFLARRLNPNAAVAGPAAGGQPPVGGMPAGSPPTGTPAGGNAPAGMPAGGPGAPGAGVPSGAPGAGGPGMGGGGRGDISQMIERLPKIAVSDLKPGDAVVISGVATGMDNSALVANTLIAGVEPILQAAPQRQRGGSGNSVGGDWGLGEMSAPQ